MVTTCDAAIVGGGPGGASCALWLKMLGHRPLIIDKRDKLGGLQLDTPYLNNWIVGVQGLTGQQLADATHDHIVSEGISLELSAEVTSIEKRENGFRLSLSRQTGESFIDTTYVVLASGVRAATGGLAAARGLIFGPGTQVASGDFDGKAIAILGGGDNAFENYLFVKSRGARIVNIYARSVVARREFLEQVPPEDVFVGVYKASPDERTVNGERYDKILVFYGWEAHLPFLRDLPVALDQRGYVETGDNCETTVDGIYAVGEVANRMHPSCVTAMADGVTAAKAIQRRLESDAGARFAAMARRAWSARRS